MDGKIISSLEKVLIDREATLLENHSLLLKNEQLNFQLVYKNQEEYTLKRNYIKVEGSLSAYVSLRIVENVPVEYVPAVSDDYYISKKSGLYPDKLMPIGKLGIIPDEERKGNEVKPLTQRRFSGLDGKDISEMVCMSHQSTLNDWLKRREMSPEAVISTIATIPQIRMTRKIVGEYTLSHTEEHKYFETSIGMVSNWKKRGPIYEVSFETLYNKQCKNLIAAGRCMSVNETLWDVMRVIPCCAVTGQAAGTAAAMTDNFSALSLEKLQAELTKSGVVLHEKDLTE